MDTEYVCMSLKEVDRLKILERVKSKKITQVKAAEEIGISKRQMIRIYKTFQQQGISGIVSRKRGKPSNRKMSEQVREAVLKTIQTKYSDFGPTLAHEKLTGLEHFKIGLESVRQLMIRGGLWKKKTRKQIKPHQMRTRRSQRGELVQIDGSPHDWFEGRAPKCCLLLAVDDATSEVMAGFFIQTESLEGYFNLMQSYLNGHGRPMALYSDKHGIFRVNAKEAQSGSGETQFARVCRELDIELICANTPQAKGRIERMNLTFQDCLIKEMRLLGISDMKAANAFLPSFIRQMNTKFAVSAASPVDAHRKELPTQAQLDLIFSTQSIRKLSKSLELQYHNESYQVQVKTASYAMRGATVLVADRNDEITLLYKGRKLDYKKFNKHNQPQEIISSKAINDHFDRRTLGNKPKDSHPWKKHYPEKTIVLKKDYVCEIA